VDEEAKQGSPRCCTTRRDEKQRPLQLVSFLMNGLLLPGNKLVESLELLIAPGDRIALEGDNQKQTDS
jgi:malonate decarboxylase alpha subunit